MQGTTYGVYKAGCEGGVEREEEREVEEYTGLVGRSLARRMLLYRQG